MLWENSKNSERKRSAGENGSESFPHKRQKMAKSEVTLQHVLRISPCSPRRVSHSQRGNRPQGARFWWSRGRGRVRSSGAGLKTCFSDNNHPPPDPTKLDLKLVSLARVALREGYLGQRSRGCSEFSRREPASLLFCYNSTTPLPTQPNSTGSSLLWPT